MADIDTNVTSTPDEPGTNDEGIKGTQTQRVQTEETPKTFTQEDVNKLVQARLAEKERTLKTKHEKELESKIAAAREDAQKELDKLVEDRVTARLAEQELTKTRTAIMEEFGLSEDQAARLQGETPDALEADAEKVFGAFKQLPRPKPPILKPGEGNSVDNPLDISKMTPAEVRANAAKLWPSSR